jgi:hypothetical protein
MSSPVHPLSLPGELEREIRATAKETGLSMADVMRQSIKLGLPALRKRLGRPCRVTNVDPLPVQAARELYAQREEDIESIRKFIVAQPKEAE